MACHILRPAARACWPVEQRGMQDAVILSPPRCASAAVGQDATFGGFLLYYYTHLWYMVCSGSTARAGRAAHWCPHSWKKKADENLDQLVCRISPRVSRLQGGSSG